MGENSLEHGRLGALSCSGRFLCGPWNLKFKDVFTWYVKDVSVLKCLMFLSYNCHIDGKLRIVPTGSSAKLLQWVKPCRC